MLLTTILFLILSIILINCSIPFICIIMLSLKQLFNIHKTHIHMHSLAHANSHTHIYTYTKLHLTLFPYTLPNKLTTNLYALTTSTQTYHISTYYHPLLSFTLTIISFLSFYIHLLHTNPFPCRYSYHTYFTQYRTLYIYLYFLLINIYILIYKFK